MPYSQQCHPASALGLVNIQVAVPYTGTLAHLGHATDMIDIANRPYLVDVHGDRNGGPQGPPIEIQLLGKVYMVSFALSTWVSATVVLLRDWCQAAAGTIAQTEVGQFLMTTKSVRLLLDTPDAGSVMNFWCAIPREPIRVGVGTKFSEYLFQFECHRPPCGHGKAGILFDTSNAAYS